MKKLLSLSACLLSFFGVSPLWAADEAAEPAVASENRVGGHIGMAVQIVTFANQTDVIGSDMLNMGIAPGITVKLDSRWAVDFEFVAYSNFKNSSLTSIVIDPGVIYNFGPMAAGLRAAVHVGGGQTQNFGLIPIALKSFPLGDSKLAAFIELDLPIFFNENGAALTIQPQLGIAF